MVAGEERRSIALDDAMGAADDRQAGDVVGSGIEVVEVHTMDQRRVFRPDHPGRVVWPRDHEPCQRHRESLPGGLCHGFLPDPVPKKASGFRLMVDVTKGFCFFERQELWCQLFNRKILPKRFNVDAQKGPYGEGGDDTRPGMRDGKLDG